jgi:hypothetical protein
MKTVDKESAQNPLAPMPVPMPVPVQVPYIVPPGTEPPLQDHRFGFHPPSNPARQGTSDSPTTNLYVLFRSRSEATTKIIVCREVPSVPGPRRVPNSRANGVPFLEGHPVRIFFVQNRCYDRFPIEAGY